MNTKFNQIAAIAMSLVTIASMVSPALAAQVSGDGQSVPVELTVEKPTFSVTVPTGLPVAVDAAGKVYCSTNATIKNNTFGQVKVSNVTIDGNAPWSIADWNLDMQKEKVNTAKIAMQLNNGVTTVSGYDFQESNFPVMDGHGTLPLTYDAKLPAQTKVISGDTVANVVFTVGWNSAEAPKHYDITPLQDIVGDDGVAHVNVGDSIQLNATAVYGSGEPNWTCEQTDVIEITKNTTYGCIAKILAPGTATIKYNNNGVIGEIQFEAKAPLKGISLDHETLVLNKNSEADLHVTYNPDNTTDSKAVTWKSNHSDIVSVVDGHLVAKNWGEATITATVGGHTAQCVVTVPKVLSGVTLSEHDITIENGSQHKLTAAAQYREIPVWSVIEGNCVTVNDGNISATAPGIAKVQVQIGEFTDTCTVHVTQKLNSISLSQTSLKFNALNQTAHLNVIYNPSNTTENKNVQWSVSPARVASVVNGKVTITDWGKATITAKVGNKIATCSITVDDGKVHATGSPIDKNIMANELKTLTGKISFSREEAPLSGTIPLNSDGTVVAVKNPNGKDATIYAKDGGGVYAPSDSSNMFNSYVATDLNLTGLDTSLATNMSSMFFGTSATSLDLSSFNTSNVTTMHRMFWKSKAVVIDGLKNFDTRNVTNMGSMFAYSMANILDLSSFNTRNVTDIRSMFYNCAATTLNVSSFDTSKISDMSMLFYGTKAKKLNLSNFNTSNVTNMRSMFRDAACDNLDLSKFDTKKVTNMYAMFYNTVSQTIDLSSFDVNGVTDMNSMFAYSRVSKIYCRSEQDRNKMLKSPAITLSQNVFVVK